MYTICLMLFNKKDQTAFAERIQQQSSKNIADLRLMYEDLFCIGPDGDKVLKSNVTLMQLQFIKMKLLEIDAIYSENNLEFEALERDKTEESIKIAETKDSLTSFCTKRDIEIPKFFKNLYGL